MKKIIWIFIFIFLLLWNFSIIYAQWNNLSNELKQKIDWLVWKLIVQIENNNQSVYNQIQIYEKLDTSINKLKVSSSWDKLLILNYLYDLFNNKILLLKKNNYSIYIKENTHPNTDTPNSLILNEGWKETVIKNLMDYVKIKDISFLNNYNLVTFYLYDTFWSSEIYNLQSKKIVHQSSSPGTFTKDYKYFIDNIQSEYYWDYYIKIYKTDSFILIDDLFQDILKDFGISTDYSYGTDWALEVFESYDTEKDILNLSATLHSNSDYNKIVWVKNYTYNFNTLEFKKVNNDAQNYKLIQSYYDYITNWDYETAYKLKEDPWYDLNKFKELYGDVTKALPDLSNAKVIWDNEYSFNVSLYLNNWTAENYLVKMKVIGKYIQTISSVKTNN